MSAQAPSAVILVRATKFLPNPSTAADNAFQSIYQTEWTWRTQQSSGGDEDGDPNAAARNRSLPDVVFQKFRSQNIFWFAANHNLRGAAKAFYTAKNFAGVA